MHKDPAEVYKITEAMDECKMAEGIEQGDRFVDYYDSVTAMGIDIPKTPKNDLMFSLLYEAMLKNHEIGLQNQKSCL